MKFTLWTHWFDIHAAHRDPFSESEEIHGHLWRVRAGMPTEPGTSDVRDLLSVLKFEVNKLDHSDLGRWSTEHIAQHILKHLDGWATLVQVEEIGICMVEAATW